MRKREIKFSLHTKTLPGTPDIVFRNEKIAVFVDGDFWHCWRFPVWKHKLKRFWKDKIETNRKRDQRNFRNLRRLGWKVIRIWEHQIKADVDACVERIMKVLVNR